MKVLAATLIALLATASAVRAQTEDVPAPGRLETAGVSASFRLGMWSSTRDLDREGPVGAAMVWGKVTRPLATHVSFLVEGWTALRGPFDSGEARGELREAFIAVTAGPLELRAGRQVIAWGRADGINPTDNLTGQDLTLLAPEDSDRRLGATAVRASYYVGDLSATVIWLPEFRGHRVPLPLHVGSAMPPAERWALQPLALRLEQTGRAVDWSISAFRGRDLSPDLGVREDGGTLRPSVTHHTVRVIGADAAGNVGRYALRAEAAYMDTDDGRGVEPFTKNPFFDLVAGGDRTFHERLNVNAQYLFRYVTRFTGATDPGGEIARVVAAEQASFSGQNRRTRHGASIRVSNQWLHDTVEGEVAAAGYVAPHGLTLRPKVTYAVTDRFKVLAGGELYRGEASSLFGILGENSGGYLEARWSF